MATAQTSERPNIRTSEPLHDGDLDGGARAVDQEIVAEHHQSNDTQKHSTMSTIPTPAKFTPKKTGVLINTAKKGGIIVLATQDSKPAVSLGEKQWKKRPDSVVVPNKGFKPSNTDRPARGLASIADEDAFVQQVTGLIKVDRKAVDKVLQGSIKANILNKFQLNDYKAMRKGKKLLPIKIVVALDDGQIWYTAFPGKKAPYFALDPENKTITALWLNGDEATKLRGIPYGDFDAQFMTLEISSVQLYLSDDKTFIVAEPQFTLAKLLETTRAQDIEDEAAYNEFLDSSEGSDDSEEEDADGAAADEEQDSEESEDEDEDDDDEDEDSDADDDSVRQPSAQ
eukprot:COSAG02_NODE_2_length_75708_cov_87.013953_58_plen_341_part_00